jgi:hypothetical protein
MHLAFAVYFITVEEGSLAHSPWGMAPPGVWAAKAYHLAPIMYEGQSLEAWKRLLASWL